MPEADSRRKTLANSLLFLGTCALILLLTEPLLRLRYAEPRRAATPEILAIQAHLQLHPSIGFTWNTDVAPEQNIVLRVSDAEFPPLSTDEFGFINHPDAIAGRAAGEAIDIIGLGDSFIEHASHNFYEFFDAHGLTYYGMALHRQAPPQYTLNLERWALPMDPAWIVYGLFENDFIETDDFIAWKDSGLDWFTFHSGTWCGSSRGTTPLARFKDEHLKGYVGLFGVLRSRLRGERMSVAGPSPGQIQRVLHEVQKAQRLATQHDTQFLLLLIPSRVTAVNGATPEARAYDTIVENLDSAGLRLVDLRQTFSEHRDPASLYYDVDGHWNSAGMEVAAREILEAIHLKSKVSVSVATP